MSTPDQPTDLNPLRAADGPRDAAGPKHDGQYMPLEPAVPPYGQYAPQGTAVPQDPAAAPYAQYGVPQPGVLPYHQPADGYSAYPTGGAYPAYPAQQYDMPVYRSYSQNKLAVWSLVLGILGVGLCGALTGIAALITGLYARKAVARGEANNGGMAIAGIVLGSVGIAWWILALVVA